jgi:lipopolysaccharide/colanic/teichoic acid biosynthesis glycosyltransferase
MAEPHTVILLGGGLAGIALRVVRQQFVRLKRAADLIIAAMAMVLSAPCLVVLMALVKVTSKGPIFFRQQRVGRDGRLFEIIKLRTMRVDAEAHTGPVWAKKNDPRVTRVGGLLRASHLDELPQLINVFMGDMSIVGPRPERPVFVRQFIEKFPDYARRLEVRPGITGLAQIRCRADEDLSDVRRKLRMDLIYVRRMCWLVDFRIMVETLRFLTGRAQHRRPATSS